MFTGHVHCTKVWGFEAAFLSSLFALFPSSQQLTGAEYDAGGYVRRGKELATTAQNIGAQEGTSLWQVVPVACFECGTQLNLTPPKYTEYCGNLKEPINGLALITHCPTAFCNFANWQEPS